jgi:hypothetical protein
MTAEIEQHADFYARRLQKVEQLRFIAFVILRRDLDFD